MPEESCGTSRISVRSLNVDIKKAIRKGTIMVTGIVLINVERAYVTKVAEAVLKLKGVTEVYTVAGEYDLVAMIRVKTNADLADVVANRLTHDIDGIIHTKTLISLDAISKINLDSIVPNV